MTAISNQVLNAFIFCSSKFSIFFKNSNIPFLSSVSTFFHKFMTKTGSVCNKGPLKEGTYADLSPDSPLNKEKFVNIPTLSQKSKTEAPKPQNNTAVSANFGKTWTPKGFGNSNTQSYWDAMNTAVGKVNDRGWEEVVLLDGSDVSKYGQLVKYIGNLMNEMDQLRSCKDASSKEKYTEKCKLFLAANNKVNPNPEKAAAVSKESLAVLGIIKSDPDFIRHLVLAQREETRERSRNW